MWHIFPYISNILSLHSVVQKNLRKPSFPPPLIQPSESDLLHLFDKERKKIQQTKEGFYEWEDITLPTIKVLSPDFVVRVHLDLEFCIFEAEASPPFPLAFMAWYGLP